MLNGARRGRGAVGLTLPEAMLATALLGVATVGVVQAVATGQTQTYDALHADRALGLAEAMMEEIVILNYHEDSGAVFGPEAGESTRADFDDVDDYDGYTELAGALNDAAGAAYPEPYQKFDVSVAVTSETLNLTTWSVTQQGVTVVVTVTDATTGRAWAVTRYVPEPVE